MWICHARIEALRACEDWAQLEEEWTRQWLGGNSESLASSKGSFKAAFKGSFMGFKRYAVRVPQP